jgi:hypothetical protein
MSPCRRNAIAFVNLNVPKCPNGQFKLQNLYEEFDPVQWGRGRPTAEASESTGRKMLKQAVLWEDVVLGSLS